MARARHSDPFAPVCPSRVRRRRVRRALRMIATALITMGLALLGSVAAEQWGSAIGTSGAQAVLRAQVAAEGLPERPIPGGIVGFIWIPRIQVDAAFVQGVGLNSLAKGPGHYAGTPLPGAPGNVAIAGHRTTHSAPFWALDALGPGDLVTLDTRAGAFVYRVVWRRVVGPYDWSVIGPTAKPSLTLTTCNPRFSGTERMVVRAILVSGRLAPKPSVTPIEV
jgi:sortase A